jgi:hypothetical protein
MAESPRAGEEYICYVGAGLGDATLEEKAEAENVPSF